MFAQRWLKVSNCIGQTKLSLFGSRLHGRQQIYMLWGKNIRLYNVQLDAMLIVVGVVDIVECLGVCLISHPKIAAEQASSRAICHLKFIYICEHNKQRHIFTCINLKYIINHFYTVEQLTRIFSSSRAMRMKACVCACGFSLVFDFLVLVQLLEREKKMHEKRTRDVKQIEM